MKNNKGFGTRELLITVLLMLSATAFFMALTLSGADNQKLTTFKENASTFAKTIITNQASFPNVDVIYLGEAVNEGVMKNIKNALGGGECDMAFSKVEFRDGKAFTTLKCGKYLVDNYEIKNIEDIPIYEVSEWSEKKPSGKDVEETTLYNCKDGEKIVFDAYYEPFFLVFRVNDTYNETARTLDAIEKKTALKLVEKKFYRTKKLIEEEK